MSRFKLRSAIPVILVLAVCLPASAATVLQMNLEQMVDRADKVFRGTVLDVREDKIQIGGGELPVVTYRLRVDESFKGSFQEIKGLRIAEVKMVGTLKMNNSTSTLRQGSTLPELPQLQVGHDYLLLTTAPSTVGLSTTVGLGQGRFEIEGKAGQEVAVNDNKNLGLFRGMDSGSNKSVAQTEGALPYATLANMIRGMVSE